MGVALFVIVYEGQQASNADKWILENGWSILDGLVGSSNISLKQQNIQVIQVNILNAIDVIHAVAGMYDFDWLYKVDVRLNDTIISWKLTQLNVMLCCTIYDCQGTDNFMEQCNASKKVSDALYLLHYFQSNDF